MAGPLHLPSMQALAIPGVSILIFFLSYSSQYLFYYLEPGPLSGGQAIWFNGAVLAIWWCYFKACTVDPGPKGWARKWSGGGGDDEGKLKKGGGGGGGGVRWCRKCEAVKPPRTHHCKTCGRCIPKMDHHCPWTANCVSYTNFPHFIRFVFYAVVSMSILTYHLILRVLAVWETRNLPAYLGPPVWALAHLMVLLLANSMTLFALSILLVRALYSLAINTTMIESWEIERHEALVDRARKLGGYVYANGGQRMRVERQEFPYDIGIWRNLCQAMGTRNVVLWFMPFGGAPGIGQAGKWEVNGFEDESKVWPPPDPDKMPRVERPLDSGADAPLREYGSVAEEMEAFKKRQQEDQERRKVNKAATAEYEDDHDESDDYESEYEEGIDGEAGWTNSDGDRLRDYGVDEETEVLAEDDIPLGELLRRRKARAYS